MFKNNNDNNKNVLLFYFKIKFMAFKIIFNGFFVHGLNWFFLGQPLLNECIRHYILVTKGAVICLYLLFFACLQYLTIKYYSI